MHKRKSANYYRTRIVDNTDDGPYAPPVDTYFDFRYGSSVASCSGESFGRLRKMR